MHIFSLKIFVILLICGTSSGFNFLQQFGFPSKFHGNEVHDSKSSAEEKLDDVFELLADVESPKKYIFEEKFLIRPQNSENFKNKKNSVFGAEYSLSDSEEHEIPHLNTIAHDKDHSPITQKLKWNKSSHLGLHDPSNTTTQDKEPSPSLNYYWNSLATLVKDYIPATDVINDILKTVNKATTIYEKEKQRLLKFSSGATPLNPKNTATHGTIQSASRLIGKLLEPSNIEQVYGIGRNANNEDEALEQLTSMMLGVEGRTGGGYGSHDHGLTLDPVTCIALVTLAAYLIRAVFQILTLTTAAAAAGARGIERNRRSISLNIDSGHNLQRNLDPFDVPSLMTNYENRTSEPNFTYERRKLAGNGSAKWSEFSKVKLLSEMLLVYKMFLDAEWPCMESLACLHLKSASDSTSSHSLVERVFWGMTKLWVSSTPLSKALGEILSSSSLCSSENAEDKSSVCESRKSACKRCSKRKLDGYLMVQVFVNKMLEEFINRSSYLKSFL